MEAAKIDTCAESEKFVVLLMDEMHVKEDLINTRVDYHVAIIVY